MTSSIDLIYLLFFGNIGHVDFFGNLTGDSIAFIYPDLKHVLLGTFTKGQLSLGQLCYVATINFIKDDFPKVTFTKGQLISKELFKVFICNKKRTKFFCISALASKMRTNQKNKGTLTTIGGFYFDFLTLLF